MWKLMPTFLISCVIAGFSHMFSTYDNRLGRYINKDRILYFVMIVIMTGFVGLRTRYNDTATYIESYVYFVSSSGSVFDGLNFIKIGGNPGFMLMCNILKHLGFSNQLFLMFFALITVPVYLWFINKYTSNIFLSTYLLYTMGVYTFTLAAIKQCLAVAIGLVAIDMCLNKKYFRFVLLILLACTIHPYVLLFLVTPFLKFKPWTKNTYRLLLAFLLFGILLQAMMGSIIDVTSMLGKEYTQEEMSGAGVSFFRFAVCAVPLLFSFAVRKNIDEYSFEDDEIDYIFMNLSMLNSLFMFVALFGTANYFGRLANYFLIFQTISLPWLFKYLNNRVKYIFVFTAVVCYFLYFAYGNAMLHEGYNFDDMFSRITIKEFFKTAFVFEK